MPIDFPDAPVLNESFPGPNGVTYTWDGTKWTLKIQSEELLNYWTRNAVAEQLQPKSSGDQLLFDSLGIEYLETLPDTGVAAM